MVKALFVTGTDTDVGKTVVSAALTHGLKAVYWKPIQTGEVSDAEWVGKMTGRVCLPEVYRLKAPLSPHAAAELEGVSITLKGIQLPSARPLVVEGAGGVMVPLNERELMRDLIKQLALPALIVARSTLGTINHTLMTLLALREYQIPILGVVMNGPKNRGNREAIEYYGKVKVIGEVEPMEKIDLEAAFKGLTFI